MSSSTSSGTSSSKPSGSSFSKPSGSSFSKPSGSSSSKPSGSSWSWKSSGSSSWKSSGSKESGKAGETFLSLAEDTGYRDVLNERMLYRLFVHKGGVVDGFHHRIVVCSPKYTYGHVTLELGVDDRVVPRCQQYQGLQADLEFTKEVECTFAEMAEEAMNILLSMGDYNLISNNCQNFCNYFLKSMDAPQYMTTAQKGAIGMGIGAGVAALGAVALALFKGSKDDK